ncbi:hypothetical protein PF003_g13972 [Phytophthora fragariae]|nr:hypothetical protein PF003_g13972 [Phytophthora fragariae]
MDIANLLNNDDDGADWEYESSDTEEADNGVDELGEERCGLYIIRDKEVQAAYNARGELGFFSLFFTREFRASLQSWTNKTLKKKGIQEGT